MVIGDEDLETWEITIKPGSRFWMEGANDAGETRIDRLNSLRDNFVANGIAVRFDRVPGVGHNGYAVLGPVHEFFAEILARAAALGVRPAARTTIDEAASGLDHGMDPRQRLFESARREARLAAATALDHIDTPAATGEAVAHAHARLADAADRLAVAAFVTEHAEPPQWAI